MKTTIKIAIPTMILMMACGGKIEPYTNVELDPVPTTVPAPVVDAAVEAAPIEASIEANTDSGTLVCHVTTDAENDAGLPGRDVACSQTDQGAAWSYCPESQCLMYMPCDQALWTGAAHPGGTCRTSGGEIGVLR